LNRRVARNRLWFELPGFEADDIIATLRDRCPAKIVHWSWFAASWNSLNLIKLIENGG
jgi:hypothetical protein